MTLCALNVCELFKSDGSFEVVRLTAWKKASKCRDRSVNGAASLRVAETERLARGFGSGLRFGTRRVDSLIRGGVGSSSHVSGLCAFHCPHRVTMLIIGCRD